MGDGHKHGQVHNSITLHRIKQSDSELYSNFKICEGINLKHLKNILIYKDKQFMLPTCFPR